MNGDPKSVADGPARPVAYEFGDFRVDVRQRLLLLRGDGRSLPLSSRAFDTLLFFLEHPGELLDKSTLMAAIWPKVVVEENNLNQHISALRRVLGERPEEDRRFLVTVPGRGYKFVAAVRQVFDTPKEEPHTADAVARVSTAAVAEADVGASVTPKGVRWGLGAAGVILAGALLWYGKDVVVRQAVPAHHPPTATSIEVVPVHKPRLAVLPFENLSPDPSNAFFTDGLHEEILSTVAQRVPGVEVISRTTMMSYRAGPPKPLAVMARELRASHVIEGSVRREGNKIRLTLQLIDARTDGQIWSASYDRTLADTLTLESQVAEEIARQLPAQLARTGGKPAPIRDTEAFDLYLKGLLALRTYLGSLEDFRQIEALFTGAIAREPDFALAYAQRARARTIRFIASLDTSEASVSKIRSDLETARRLAPQDPIVLAVAAYFLMCENDTSGALELFAAAEAAGLADAETLIPKAHLLLRRSRIAELNATVQRMLALDPADPLVIQFAFYHLYRAQQPLDALKAAEYARVSFPQLYAGARAYLLADFAGRTEELHSFLERYEPMSGPLWLGPELSDYFTLLTYEHRYAELKALLDRVPVASGPYFTGVDYGPVGQTPTALPRGWTDLLLADKAAAARDGQAVLRFVQQQVRSNWNTVYLDSLEAAGSVFVGDCERARATGKAALSHVARADNAVIWNTTAMDVARTMAWCGGEADAIALLQQVSVGKPGIGPGAITRDPLLTVPLGRLPAYRALADHLEETIRATKIE
jgi:TolB-like protein/DNA-binding winged helix-turn-helix (wHTH) protein